MYTLEQYLYQLAKFEKRHYENKIKTKIILTNRQTGQVKYKQQGPKIPRYNMMELHEQ